MGFGVSAGRSALPAHASEAAFFRVVKQTADNVPYRDFLAAQARWREAGIFSYSYVVRSNRGQVSYEARYTVVNGEVTAMETVSIYPPFFTAPAELMIDDLFETVSSGFEQNAETVDVAWNADAGDPERGFIDLDEPPADEEQSWTILEFFPLVLP